MERVNEYLWVIRWIGTDGITFSVSIEMDRLAGLGCVLILEHQESRRVYYNIWYTHTHTRLAIFNRRLWAI